MKRIRGLALLVMIIMTHPGEAAFGGFRVGGMLGVHKLQGRHFYTGKPCPESDFIHRFSTLSGMFGVHGGYLLEIGGSKIVVGVEGYMISPGVNTTLALNLLNGSPEGQVNVQHTHSIGLLATVGMMLNPKIMAYISAGAEKAKFQFRYTFSDPTLTGAGVNGGLPANQLINRTFSALVPAVGVTYKFSPHLLFGIEVASPFFKRFKIRLVPPRAYHYKPVERRAFFKVSYLF